MLPAPLAAMVASMEAAGSTEGSGSCREAAPPSLTFVPLYLWKRTDAAAAKVKVLGHQGTEHV